MVAIFLAVSMYIHNNVLYLKCDLFEINDAALPLMGYALLGMYFPLSFLIFIYAFDLSVSLLRRI